MTHTTTPLTDTRDMIFVHDAIRRALGEALEQIACTPHGDIERAHDVASHLGEALWFLHAHHNGEDELLYPLLVERAPQAGDLFARMDAQHTAVAEGIESAQQATQRFGTSGSAADGAALTAACRSLLDAAADHLAEEEAEILPIASRTITSAEWAALPGHVLSHYTGARSWLLLGLVFARWSFTSCVTSAVTHVSVGSQMEMNAWTLAFPGLITKPKPSPEIGIPNLCGVGPQADASPSWAAPSTSP